MLQMPSAAPSGPARDSSTQQAYVKSEREMDGSSKGVGEISPRRNAALKRARNDTRRCYVAAPRGFARTPEAG